MLHKVLAYLGAFDVLRPFKAEKITADTQIKYSEPMVLDDLDLVYWGFIKDLLSSSNAEYLGVFDSVLDIEALEGSDGDFAILNRSGGFSLYVIIEDVWQLVGSLYLRGLRVVKNPDNLDGTRLEQYDYCEGWLSPNLFVNGLWKLDTATAPTQVQMMDTNNWSNFIKIG